MILLLSRRVHCLKNKSLLSGFQVSIMLCYDLLFFIYLTLCLCLAHNIYFLNVLKVVSFSFKNLRNLNFFFFKYSCFASMSVMLGVFILRKSPPNNKG